MSKLKNLKADNDCLRDIINDIRKITKCPLEKCIIKHVSEIQNETFLYNLLTNK